jgi:hypothetical protein
MPAADFDPKLAAQIGVEQRVILDAWKRRDSSGTFRHEFMAHNDLSCDTCHTVGTINTLDPKTKRVSVTACATCHVTATVDDGRCNELRSEVAQDRLKVPVHEMSYRIRSASDPAVTYSVDHRRGR